MDGVTTEHHGAPAPWYGDASELPPDGTTLGRYADLREIGRGGMAAVYRARDTQLGRVVALKVLRHGAAAPEALRERFAREIALQANLDIPGVVPLHDCNVEGRWLYFSMPLIQGERLDKFRREGDCTTAVILSVLGRLAKVVARLHAADRVHGDLKPHNVLVDSHGEVRLLDLGLARALGPAAPCYQTQNGERVGTPAYLPPERLADPDRRADAAGDVFALGLIAYEMLSRRQPWDLSCRTWDDAALAVREKPVPLVHRCPALPPELCDAVHLALSADPAVRCDAAALAEALAKPAAQPVPRRMAGTALIAVGLVCLGMALAVVWRGRQTDGETVSPAVTRPARGAPTSPVEPLEGADDMVTLHLAEAPSQLRPAFEAAQADLSHPDLAGRGGLLYELPPNARLRVRRGSFNLLSISAAQQARGVLYRRDGEPVTLRLVLGDEILDLSWNPVAGQVDVLH